MNTKIELLEKSMEVKKRNDDTEFTCFTDTAPEELKSLFLNHYEVRDVDYQIFSKAIDTIVEAYNDYDDKNVTGLSEYIRDNYNDFSSPYNSDRLAYLNVWNDDEVAEIARNYACQTVSEACAIWFDEQMHQAITRIIDNYLLKE